ncbi:MAG TPA: hypothetical protein P5567_06835 [Kiritimatiellia bacterium]|nr:hypothetical protein [Kiritimatiellia bacterium]HRZ12153.1 hypothetical protein [Kiritimatiellia bacterium]HSA18089.1 hypothetical protein [Kiritimatiellia bacterium]
MKKAILLHYLFFAVMSARAQVALTVGCPTPECPSLTVTVPTNACRPCTGSYVVVCASITNLAAGCYQNSNYNYSISQTNWKWKVDGIEAAPSSGIGECAEFTNKTAGSGQITYSVDASMAVGPITCSVHETAIKPFTSHDLQLYLMGKTNLGINMYDPVCSPTGSLTAKGPLVPEIAELPYTWTLEGVCIFDPVPDSNSTSAVIKEQCTPSPRYQHEVVRVNKHCWTREQRFTVVQVDVSVGVSEGMEETQGVFIAVNDNDSDGSGYPDNTEAPLLSDDPDLMPVTITICPADLPTNQMVSVSGIGHCYEDRRKMTNALSSYSVARVGQGLTLYLEGASAGEVEFIDAVHPESGACDKAKYTVLKVEIVVELEDQEVNGVRSGLKQDTLKFDFNDNVIHTSHLTLQPTTATVDGEQITTKLRVFYVPSCNELNLPGSNTVKVDIDDMVDNHIDQVVNTFQLP